MLLATITQATKKCAIVVQLLFALGVSMLLASCAASGPGLLLKGERAVQARQYPQAVKYLDRATKKIEDPRVAARAWNFLGLAQHQSGSPAPARAAYLEAIKRDRNYPDPKFNLGCLYLELNSPALAADLLATYCVLEPASVAGWLKLTVAYLRTQRWIEAERSAQQTLKLVPRHPEALNLLGVIQVEKRRPREALQWFQVASADKNPYAPAVYNMAVTLHAQFNSRAIALKKYREFLALKPASSSTAAVQALVNQLSAELNPPLTSAVPAMTTTRTFAHVSSNRPGLLPAPGSTNRPGPPFVAAPATNRFPIGRPATSNAPAPSVSAPPPVEVVSLPGEPVITTAQDLPGVRPAPNNRPTSLPNVVIAPLPQPEREKEGFLDKLNPSRWFRGRSRTETRRSPERRPDGAPTPLSPATNAPGPAREPDPPATVPAPQFARYRYGRPAVAPAGNRAAAQSYLATGLTAHRQRQWRAALAAYEQAAAMDPRLFEAQYNLGLAALESGDVPRSLQAYEMALAINPASTDARYNFAIALQAGSYPLDAAAELERIVAANPSEGRAHYLLAEIYAQQLNQPHQARPHFQRVLQLDPRHLQAPAIRRWLLAHP